MAQRHNLNFKFNEPGIFTIDFKEHQKSLLNLINTDHQSRGFGLSTKRKLACLCRLPNRWTYVAMGHQVAKRPIGLKRPIVSPNLSLQASIREHSRLP
jgi:hypothetical protein